MRFIESVQRAAALLRQQGRISLRALKREFDLDDEDLEALVQELVDVQQVAALQGKVLSWMGSDGAVPESAPDPATPEAAERRQLTVVFCDLAGSTRLAASLDPEDWREIVRAYQHAAGEVVERFEGHVAQYLGDGLLLYFGWPTAHEDDAERAVRASLEIAEAVARRDPRLAVRIGIHTGPVVVGEMGRGAARETLAMGGTTNVAAHLQTEASPGSVVMSQDTLRLVSGLFLTSELGLRRLKGVAEPLRAHAVLGSAGRRSRAKPSTPGLGPLVGRDHELGFLLERWEQVQEGEAQTVLVSGEAGLGKSRLLQAFRDRLEGERHLWLEGDCTPYTRDTAFYPVRDVIERSLDVSEETPPEGKLRRLELAVQASGVPPEDVLPFLAPLLAIPLPDRYAPPELAPELRRRRTFESLVRWAHGVAQHRPVVILYEDLQWSDPLTIEFLGAAMERAPISRVLVLATFRPEFEPPWLARSHLKHLQLSRLSRRQSRSLVRSITTGHPLPDDVIDRILDRADGVPLFLEELTRSVAEAETNRERDGEDVSALAIPTTLHDSLMARLDRLSAAKAVAQTAAVIGREFRFDLLAAVSELDEETLRHGLDRLIDSDLVLHRGVARDVSYVFRHALLQDAAYGSLLKARRRELHERIARWLEGAGDGAAEVTARHFEEAGLPLDAALHYLRAGENSLIEGREGAGYLQRGAGVLASAAPGEDRDLLAMRIQNTLAHTLGELVGWSAPGAMAAAEQAAALAGSCPEGDESFDAIQNLAAAIIVGGRIREAEPWIAQLMERAERSRKVSDRFSATSLRGFAAVWSGHPQAAIDDLERAIELEPDCELRRLQELGVFAIETTLSRAYLAMALLFAGRFDRCREVAGSALERARELDEARWLGRGYGRATAMWGITLVHHELRLYEETVRWARQCESYCRERGFDFQEHATAFLRVSAASRIRNDASASQTLRQHLSVLAGGMNAGSWAPSYLAMLAEAQLREGRVADASSAFERASQYAAETGQRYYDAELHRIHGEILRASGAGAEEIEGAFREGLSTAYRCGRVSLELRSATALARSLADGGRRDEARTLLRSTVDRIAEGDGIPDVVDARSLLEALS